MSRYLHGHDDGSRRLSNRNQDQGQFSQPKCAVCKNIFTRPHLSSYHDRTPESLQQSANNTGCQGCRLLSDGVESLFGQDIRKCENPDPFVRLAFSSDSAPIVIVTWAEEKEWHIINLWCPGKLTCASQNISLGNNLVGDISLQQAVQTAEQWIGECHKHPKCGIPNTSHLPIRTISVGSSNSDIHLADNKNSSERYICLSHCWGLFQPLTTTSNNLADHHSQIPWNSLPKTFQDAILLTRALKIKHLWIDSLCIIQDSPSDWAIESSKMAEIYSNAFLTLAAAASSDGRGGLFRQHTDDELSLSHRFLLPSQPRTTNALVTAGLHESLNQPLLERGWVLQEQLLSKRILYFNEYEIAWQCQTRVTCECGQPEPPPVEKWTDLPMENTWARLVFFYSRLKLTRGTDVLPALSGIARAFQEGTFPKIERKGHLQEYCAGLWEEDLIDQLCWKVNSVVSKPRSSLDPAGSGADAEEYRAPSWSWASVDKAVDFHDFKHAPPSRPAFRAEIISINCQPSTENPFGTVRPGSYMEVSVRLIPATLHCSEKGPSSIHPRGKKPTRHASDPNKLFGSNIRLDRRAQPLVPHTEISLAVIQMEAASFGDMSFQTLILEASACAVDGIECFRRLGFVSDKMARSRYMGHKALVFVEPVPIRII